MTAAKQPRIDAYTVRARIYPPLLALLPLIVFGIVWFGHNPELSPGLLSILVICGGTYLLSQLGRDAGKRKEAELFRKWGGMPSIRLLRYSQSENKTSRTALPCSPLSTLLPKLKLPEEKEETDNPARADEAYATACRYLRENTRNKHEFHVLHEENANYGFRRNLWGLKPVGIGVACLMVGLPIWTGSNLCRRYLTSEVPQFGVPRRLAA